MSDLVLNRLKAKVHIGKSKLGLDDDTYRDLLARVAGLRSTKAMSAKELGLVLDEMKRLGFADKPGPRRPPARARTRRIADGAQQAKIRALWLGLYHLGAVQDPAESAIFQFARRMGVTVDAFDWLPGDEADKVIKALRGWAARIGWDQPTANEVQMMETWRMQAQAPSLRPLTGAGFAAKCSLIGALWRRLIDAGAMRTGGNARLDTFLVRYGATVPHLLPDGAAADRAIEDLGKWLRRAKAETAAAASGSST
ncbi:MAG: gp16 family protein [Alphaproteobacteria bacterium]